MPFDASFAEVFLALMQDLGWSVEAKPEDELPNPLIVRFRRETTTVSLIIHARRLTLQQRAGESPSTHNRPAGEMHAQMIFDGDQKGTGQKQLLRFLPGYKTCLFGYYLFDDEYVVAAYDPEFHKEYAYSKSLQLKFDSIQRALTTGLTIQTRQSGENVVVFPLASIETYIEYADDFHKVTFVGLTQTSKKKAVTID
jgi:hypothetical protein